MSDRDGHAALLAGIGRATGLGHPMREHPAASGGMAVEVLGGTVDRAADRVAWVERHTFGAGDWVNVWLNLAGAGTADLPPVEGWAHRRPQPRISTSLVPDRRTASPTVPGRCGTGSARPSAPAPRPTAPTSSSAR